MPDVLTPELLGRALGDAPNPEMARVAVSRLGERPAAREQLERPEIIPAAARLLGFSTAAADFFLAHPEELESLAIDLDTPEDFTLLRDRLLLDPQPAPRTAKVLWQLGDRAEQAAA